MPLITLTQVCDFDLYPPYYVNLIKWINLRSSQKNSLILKRYLDDKELY